MIGAIEVLQYDFMRRALLAAVLIGLSAPAVGIFLVQRRLALIGDGIGHIAVSGVALGLVVGHAPILIALVTAIAGAVTIEVIRARGEAFGEIALAILFYGGIAGGVVLVSRAPSGTRNLNQYLFGSITTTSASDLITFSILAAVILALTTWLGPALFAVSNDDEFARASGLPVMPLNIVLAVTDGLHRGDRDACGRRVARQCPDGRSGGDRPVVDVEFPYCALAGDGGRVRRFARRRRALRTTSTHPRAARSCCWRSPSSA